MPLPIVWRLHRPLRERLIIAFLLSVILCATAAASVKLYYVRVIVLEGEQLRSLVAPTLWSRIEEIALIAAACAPSLKSSTEDGLRQCWHCCARHRQQERSSSCVSESVRCSLRAFWISMRLRHCVCRSERTGNLRESETLMLSDYKLVISAMTSVSAWTMAGFYWLSQAWQDKGAGDRKVEPDICSELLMSCNTILTD